MDSRWTQGLFTLAALVLVVLKLAGEITWSWVIVLAPLWVPAALAVSLRLTAVAVVAAVAYLVIFGMDVSRLPDVLNRIPLVRELPWEQLT